MPSIRGVYRRVRAARARVTGRAYRSYSRRKGINIGSGLRLNGFPVITKYPNARVTIGQDVTLSSNITSNPLGLNHRCVIKAIASGAQIYIASDVGMSGGSITAAYSVSIGSGTLIGADVRITDTDFHPLHDNARRYKPLPDPKPSDAINIGTNVFVGTSAIILKGVTIGDDSVIGAGSVVTKSVPAGKIYAGNPAIEVGIVRTDKVT